MPQLYMTRPGFEPESAALPLYCGVGLTYVLTREGEAPRCSYVERPAVLQATEAVCLVQRRLVNSPPVVAMAGTHGMLLADAALLYVARVVAARRLTLPALALCAAAGEEAVYGCLRAASGRP